MSWSTDRLERHRCRRATRPADASDGTRIKLSTTDRTRSTRTSADQLNVLLVLALGAIIAAAGLAAVQARQLARPLERLATAGGTARRRRLQPATVHQDPHPRDRRDRLVARHQCSAGRHDARQRTPLHRRRNPSATNRHRRHRDATRDPHDDAATESGRRRSAPPAWPRPTSSTPRSTICSLRLAIAPPTSRRSSISPQLVIAHADEWRPRFEAVKRHISVITANPAPPVFGTKGLVGQVIDILIDNAIRHGAGAVTLMIDGPAVIVIDQGPGVDRGSPQDDVRRAGRPRRATRARTAPGAPAGTGRRCQPAT